MGVLGDFFLAAGGGTPNYDAGAWPDMDRVETNRVTPLEAAVLLAILRQEPDLESLIDDFEPLTDEDADEWTYGTPEDFARRLAGLTAGDVQAIGEAFAVRTEQELGWPEDACVAFVEELRDLALRGAQSERAMFFWNSL